MFEGRIYKIYCKDIDVNRVYIGQTKKTLEKRWDGHKRDANQVLHKKLKSKDSGKAAKLHKAIINNGADAMERDELEVHQYQDENELQNKLNEREIYYIDQYDSINNGWNKVYASKIKLPLGEETKITWENKAKKHGVSVRKLRYQMITNGLNEVDAVNAVKKLEKKPTKRFSYGKQIYKKIKDLLIYDKHRIGRTNIGKRIRDARQEKRLRVDYDREKNVQTVFLIDSIFDPVLSRGELIVCTPEGKIKGDSIKELHDKLLPKFPDKVPESYTTVQNRINGSRLIDKWTIEQAFGLKYPPDYEHVENLIEKKGYRWGEIDGRQKIPCFKTDHKGKPALIILHSISTVYYKEQDWCDAYKLTDRKKIKELRDEGKTNEQILKYYGKEP